MIDKIWSGQNKLYWLLVPISWLYGLIVFIRRLFYRFSFFKSWKAPIPVIVVGNLSVGGNGKTPLVIYLIEKLSAKGYKAGVVARGYGGKSDSYPVIVNEQTPAAIVGDEPFLIYQRTQVPFAVSPNRCDAVKVLLNQYSLDVIITDDGLQHYALQRDIEIVVVDGKRGFGNGNYLPAGPMRESSSRLKSIDYLVVNGKTKTNYKHAFTMELASGDAINLSTRQHQSLSELKSVCAMAGIGDPTRFFDMLKRLNVNLVSTVPFTDHQNYTKEQLTALVNLEQTLLMTEKDAVKCLQFAQSNWWYLPVDAVLPEQFINDLCNKINEL